MADLLSLQSVGRGLYESDVPTRSVEEADYGRGIPFGRDRAENVHRIKFGDKTRVGIFAPSGYGKTTLAKAMLSRLWKDLYKIFHGSDVKNDFQKVNGYGGVSNKLQREMGGLLQGESPLAMDRTMALPNFMVRQHYDARPEYGERFSLGFQDLSDADFKFLIGYESDFTSKQRDVFDAVFNEVELQDTNLDFLIEKFEDTGDGRSTKSIIRRLKNLRSSGIIDAGMWKDVLQDLNTTRCVSLGLKGWDEYYNSDTEMRKIQFYSAILHRKVTNYLKQGLVEGPLVIFNDEFHKLAPDGKKSLVKSEFQNILDLSGRQADVSTIISAQRPSQVPYPRSDDAYDFLGTLTHVFIGFNLSRSDWTQAIKATPLWNGNYSHKWAELIQLLRPYEFLYINVEKHRDWRDAKIVSSLPPLCHHGG